MLQEDLQQGWSIDIVTRRLATRLKYRYCYKKADNKVEVQISLQEDLQEGWSIDIVTRRLATKLKYRYCYKKTGNKVEV